MQAYGLLSIPIVSYPHASALHSTDENFKLSTVNLFSGSASETTRIISETTRIISETTRIIIFKHNSLESDNFSVYIYIFLF